ncbi:hypothetical protein HaLaN_23651 [Haematococcus lacustris]|uniref:F-box domain-containing protein n=1 Tax=Haematococcus lacustris TaxID=44745 RepID=A0A699ZSL0_HAELA|nr:hypothetical protein HaLaN_23651 [Haematococcus lacustris]
MLSDMLQRYPGIGSAVYQHLDCNSRSALRLVCKQLRAAINCAVSGLEMILSDRDDPDEVMSSTMPQLRSLDVYCEMDVAVHEGSLAACTQLTALRGCKLPQLTDLRLRSCPLQPSSQLSRFLFQHLTSLTVDSIHSRDLAALDCPQLQTLTLSELQVDCAASLRACASGILQHCNDIYNLLTYNHGQEFKAAAAGAGVRQLGPPPSASVLLEALAPWQPRSGKAIEKLGLWHLPDVTREAFEWLPVNIKSLTFDPVSPLPSNPLARGPPQPSPLPTPLAQLSSTCLVQLLWAFACHEHCQAALLRAAAPVLSARILQGQLSSRRVACVAWAYARLQQLEPRLLSAILRHSMAHAEQ